MDGIENSNLARDRTENRYSLFPTTRQASENKGYDMASGSTPHFHNSSGAPAIEIGTREFMCIGAKPPFDHPHIFIDMGDNQETVCPYCSTLYKYDSELATTESRPADALWVDKAA
jgi:uncharacterized Zn-finger protein